MLISSAMYSIITPHSRRESHGFPKPYISGACGDFSIVINKFRDLTKKKNIPRAGSALEHTPGIS